MKWKRGAGCLLVVVLFGVVIAWCSEPPPGGSLVRVTYAAVDRAPTLTGLRVLWGGDKWGFETFRPGDHVAGPMYPIDGGGEMTLVFESDGHKQVWSTNIGKEDVGTGRRLGVAITIGPLGEVNEKHCVHPCALSTQPWWEPWVDRVRSMSR